MTPQPAPPPARLIGETTTILPRVINGERGPAMRAWDERVEAQQQRVRQSASRRYE
jgi:hypothetical protein